MTTLDASGLDISGDAPWRDKDILIELYENQLGTIYEVGDILGCSGPAVSKWLKRNDIEARPRGGGIEYSRDGPEALTDPTMLRGLYVDEGLPTTEIAAMLGVGTTTVNKWLQRHDIDRRIPGGHWDDEYPELTDAEYLRDQYHGEGLGAPEIANRVGCSIDSIYKAMERHGIERRDPSAGKSGEEHWNWRGGVPEYYGPNWQSQREKCLERDGYACRDCGMSTESCSEVYGKGLDVHHKVPFRTFAPFESRQDYENANKLTNLVTLCAKCHQKWERIPVQPQFC